MGQIRCWEFSDIEPGESVVIDLTANVAGPCTPEAPFLNRVGAEAVSFSECTDPATAFANDIARVLCEEPDVDIEKSLDVSSVGVGDPVVVTLTVTNTGDTELDPVQVCDVIDDGVTFDEMQVIGGTCDTDLLSFLNNTICFTEFALEPDESCTIIYTIACGESGTHADTARVTAYCAGTETNPVTDEDDDSFSCGDGGFACPHTIGFWRQQCAQKGNGSTKVCLAGMENLWRCVITETDVIQWKKNDGSFETTASLAALSNANLFTALCSQLQGPRPMTLLDMAEIQYLGLMLNVCSGALPLDTEIMNGFDGTVAEAIDAIENAINTGENLDFWKTIADDINNRIGVNAEDCPGGDSLFRNVPPCNADDAGSFIDSESAPVVGGLETRAYPNPVIGRATSIFYRVPAEAGSSPVAIEVYDLTGRLVKTLVSATQAPGDYSAEWDLRDGGGQTVSAGIYFYKATVGSFQVTQKLLVIGE
jgi:uncharacterized repeat protein (TIGR01451 family)